MNSLLYSVSEAIDQNRLFRPTQALLVAVSGGVDSMVLLQILKELSPRGRWLLHVAHLNHKLRGRSSDADERLVRRTAKELGVPATIEEADVRGYARRRKVSIEMAARQLRHEFLAQVAHKEGIRTIALAHHADDQVELFFLRLLRGTGVDALSGMDWSAPSPVDSKLELVRPLLECSKQQLIGYARSEGIRFREDRSNQSLDILRNRIRQELIPLLERHYQPAVRKTTLRLMDILRQESALLNAPASGWKPPSGCGRRASRFADWPVGLQRRFLQKELLRLGLTPRFDLVEDLRKFEGMPVMTEANTVVKRSGAGSLTMERLPAISFQTSQLAVPLTRGKGSFGMEGLQVEWRISRRTAKKRRLTKQNGVELFDADKIGPSIVVRHWRAGDRFQPIGMPQPVKLQDFFVNEKIPREDRHKLLLATTSSGGVIWVEGLRISEWFKLDNGTVRQLKWTWWRK